AVRGATPSCIRPAMHPRWRRCSSLKYCPIFSVVAPCQRGASPSSVRRWELHHGPLMRLAFVHDWLTGMRGGERVLEALSERVPDAEIFTLLHVRGSVSPRIERHRIHTSPLQSLPGIRRYYRECLPLFPALVETFDLERFDIVLSSSHCVAKSAITRPETLHI